MIWSEAYGHTYKLSFATGSPENMKLGRRFEEFKHTLWLEHEGLHLKQIYEKSFFHINFINLFLFTAKDAYKNKKSQSFMFSGNPWSSIIYKKQLQPAM